MGAREPSWWYGPAAEGWVPRVLAPLGAAYGALTARRMQQAPTYRAAIPVVAIGNFTAGGTGKTPFVRVVVAALREMGHTPVVLTRGYGGTERGPRWVAPGDRARTVGDEPLLLAATAPVMVARDRAAGARAIELDAAKGASVIVMDDGLQNPALARDCTISIAIIDAVRGFGNGRCIPAGPLRAPLAVQLPRVDALVLNTGDGTGALATPVGRLLGQFNGPVLSARVTPDDDVAWLHGQQVVAFAGIGVPQRFFATVAAAGARMCSQRTFSDHHAFSEADARALLAEARALKATLVTTEKDYVRLGGGEGALAELLAACRVLPIRLQLDAASSAKLSRLLPDKSR